MSEHMPNDTLDLARIKAREQAATKGPWKHEEGKRGLVGEVTPVEAAAIELREAIEAVIAPVLAGYEPQPIYWIEGPCGDLEESYCRTCALEVIKNEAKPPLTTEDFHLSGGYSVEQDGTAWCSVCGVELECSFTDHGVSSELDHFEEHGLSLDSPAECYSLARMIDAGWDVGPYTVGSSAQHVEWAHTVSGLRALVTKLLGDWGEAEEDAEREPSDDSDQQMFEAQDREAGARWTRSQIRAEARRIAERMREVK